MAKGKPMKKQKKQVTKKNVPVKLYIAGERIFEGSAVFLNKNDGKVYKIKKKEETKLRKREEIEKMFDNLLRNLESANSTTRSY